ncbi:sialate O-acetylesterase [Thalassotalea sp. PLHSN55]|uniref:sialate O-acetylesterase n=1 Tax=Thalassotalea sp. PLHSN55 TaxID=3435888 RepID=UPI003F859779
MKNIKSISQVALLILLVGLTSACNSDSTHQPSIPGKAQEGSTGTILDEFDLSGVLYSAATQSFIIDESFTDSLIVQQGKALTVFGTAQPGTLVAIKLQNDHSIPDNDKGFVKVSAKGTWEISLPSRPLSSDTYTLTLANDSFESTLANITFDNVATGTIVDEFDLSGIAYTPASQDITLHSLMASNAIFQQQKPIRVFGQAQANTVVAVKLIKDSDGSEAGKGYTVVPESGEWQISLPALSASYESYTLVVADDAQEYLLENILIGEVWVMSGQSNMELKVSQMEGGEELMASIDEANIRIFHQAVSMGNANFPFEPQFDVLDGKWTIANSPGGVQDSSAIGLVFAQKTLAAFLARGENVPVGILNAHRGGSKIQAWLPRDVAKNALEISNYITAQQNQYIDNKFFTVDDQADWNSHDWDNYVQTSALFNQKLAPLTHFNVKGVAWYQGESDPVREANVYNLKALIDSWSALFNDSDELLDFALIQLAPYNGQDPMLDEPTNYGQYLGFADHRLAQLDVISDLKYADKVRLIPIYDVGLQWETDESIFQWKDPIHPLDKAPVGERLANMLFHSVYQDDDQFLAPVFNDLVVSDDAIIANFNRSGEGLTLFKNQESGVDTVRISNRIGQTKTVPATIVNTSSIAVSADDIAALGMDINSVSQLSYGYLSRNENSNLASSVGTPVLPFLAETGYVGGENVQPLVLFSDMLTDWRLSAAFTSAITEEVVDDEPMYGKVIEHTYVGNQVVSAFSADYVMNLSDYIGGTLEFDLKVISQPDNDANASWFIKIDCGWPCGTGDVPISNSEEGLNPTVGQWQHYTFDIDYLLGLPGGVESNALPLNISAVVSPFTVFPAWGANQSGTIFRIDNIVYSKDD